VTSDDIRKYMERELSIDCPRIVLRQNIESPDCVYEGPGSIHQTADGRLMFKLYASGPPDRSMLARIFELSSAKSGEIIPRHEYYSLEATSLKGEIWRGESVLPHLDLGVRAHGPVVTGSLYELAKTALDAPVKEHHPHLNLIFAADFDFPGNTSTTTKTFLKDVETWISGDFTPAMFDAVGLAFLFQKERGSVGLSAQSKNMTLPQNLDLRICEALEFTFFETERWVIRTVSENGQITTTLRAFPKDRIKKTSRPPVGSRSGLTGEYVWNLFAKYLEYVIPHPQAEWHPLSNSAHLAVVGDAGPLDAGLLALSVAIEGVLKTGFSQVAVPNDSLLEQIDAAYKLVFTSNLKDEFKPRVLGAIDSMRKPRAKDKLLALQRAGIIREELINAWDRTRHPAVHADGFDKKEISKILRNYQSALTLLNELVFLVIGYTGLYTDYSTTDWPERAFDKTMKDLESNLAQDIAQNNGALTDGSF
jgi:hypothetical protein